ncbi:MAG TPA: NADH-quinone oxidoreductase subunit L [Patescibacteria group bacterium]|nr:NADH-quinone oxidoreductase subunit L [Patescibacteria group bacterium]
MISVLDNAWIIPALPLAGSAVNGIFGKTFPKKTVSAVALGSTTLAFVSTLALVAEFWRLPASEIPAIRHIIPWLLAGNLRVDWAVQVDQLTIIMLLVVTGVGWLIHIYSTGYMAHEGGYYRFFSYLNLFMFFMLVLVLGANYVVMFVGWEGVGLCSYLLIGFFFLKKSAADAGKKAFVVNRVGDFGFLLGIFLMFRMFGTTDIQTVMAQADKLPVETAGVGTLTLIGLLLFVGAAGKSAQVPLYVWLPDAMEGPTPVSALIHAATMVTAGVYMVARSSTLYAHAPIAMKTVAVIGCLTAFFAATIGLVQTDIKRVLAYSTVSQLGYMFLACGVGAFSAGIFHLMTHAFFKALLFLAAGSVIHAMGGEQDMRNMGGLRGPIRTTFLTMLAATLAISGCPGFSGFFSKDEILWESYSHGNWALWFVGTFTALLTAFYMFRLVFMTFYGTPRYDEHHVHVHESPKSMLVPLVVLAVLSLGGGWMAAPGLFGGTNYFEEFLRPVFEHAEQIRSQIPANGTHETEHMLMAVAITGALLGFLVAWWMYLRAPKTAEELEEKLPGPHSVLLHKYYVDELYEALIVQPIKWISTNVLWKGVDAAGIDGAVNGLAKVTADMGEETRQVQSGNGRSYASLLVAGAAAMTLLFLWLGH